MKNEIRSLCSEHTKHVLNVLKVSHVMNIQN